MRWLSHVLFIALAVGCATPDHKLHERVSRLEELTSRLEGDIGLLQSTPRSGPCPAQDPYCCDEKEEDCD